MPVLEAISERLLTYVFGFVKLLSSPLDSGAESPHPETMSNITVQVRPLPHFEGLQLPAYETSGSAGMDVRAAVPEAEPMVLKPGERAMVPTGLSVAIPEGFEIQVRPRSGLAAKHGLTCLNTPGTIDSDYRGEIKVILINLGAEAFAIQRGERIAQLVLAPVTRLAWREVDALDETARGAGGFGSTGR
jgi:dUTP pyrophosphatase